MAVATASSPGTGWVVDRQFHWLVSALVIVAYALPSLAAGLVYDPVARRALEEAPAGTGGGASFRTLWLPLILLSIWVLGRRFRLLQGFIGFVNPALLLLLAWSLLSAAWAPDAASALRQAFSIVGVTLLTTAFALASWTPRRFVALVRSTTTVLLAASLIVGLVAPDIGIQPEDAFELAGSWRGITYQKNGLGQLAAVGMILWGHALMAGESRPMRAWAGFGLAALMVLLSRSSTSLSLALVSLLLMAAFLRSPLRLAGRGAATAVAIGLLVLVPLLIYLIFVGTFEYDAIATPVAQLFGKDASFSGRSKIWAELIREIGNHPLLGVGFNSFWGGPDSLSAEAIRRLQWNAPTGHNGYLDLVNEIGLIGFGLFLAFLFLHFRTLARIAAIDRPAFVLHLVLMVYVILANLTETGWFHPILMTHVLAMLSSADLSRRLFEQRLRQMAGAGRSYHDGR